MGILVDVSGSMRNSVGDKVNAERESWARSIFKVVDELVKHDAESSIQTFALALGCPSPLHVFDLLGTVGAATEEQRYTRDSSSRKQLREMIDEALDILERNGADTVRAWAKVDALLPVFDEATAAAMLYYLQRRPEFTRRFVLDCLPQRCREHCRRSDFGFSAMSAVPFAGPCLKKQAVERSVKEVIDKGKDLMAEIRRQRTDIKMVAVSKAAIMSVQSASDILHTSIGEKEVNGGEKEVSGGFFWTSTESQVSRLWKNVQCQ